MLQLAVQFTEIQCQYYKSQWSSTEVKAQIKIWCDILTLLVILKRYLNFSSIFSQHLHLPMKSQAEISPTSLPIPPSR